MCMVTILYLVSDIPECQRGLDDCDSNATCTNTFGSYLCTCDYGFIGDGYTCIGQSIITIADFGVKHCSLCWRPSLTTGPEIVSPLHALGVPMC